MTGTTTSIDPVVFGDLFLRLLLSPVGIVGVLCLAYAVQSALRILGGVGRPKARRSRPTTWTRF